MPLTNEFTPGEGRHRFHVWLNPHEGALTQDTSTGRISALCGQVHVVKVDELRPIEEEVDTLPEEAEDVEAFLARDDVCSLCADVAREELGLPLRELEDVPGIGGSKADALRLGGVHSVADFRGASQAQLADIEGIGNALAARIKADVGDEDDVVRP